MNAVLLAVAVWFVLSFPAGVVVGKVIAGPPRRGVR